ncbi:DUF2905 family protein [Thiolapillus sp.]|uniref:DUF2905 family protein n=1 Tax=Thiolapillus sp. TaxID=2017437 RepID=UPI003AF470D5
MCMTSQGFPNPISRFPWYAKFHRESPIPIVAYPLVSSKLVVKLLTLCSKLSALPLDFCQGKESTAQLFPFTTAIIQSLIYCVILLIRF